MPAPATCGIDRSDDAHGGRMKGPIATTRRHSCAAIPKTRHNAQRPLWRATQLARSGHGPHSGVVGRLGRRLSNRRGKPRCGNCPLARCLWPCWQERRPQRRGCVCRARRCGEIARAARYTWRRGTRTCSRRQAPSCAAMPLSGRNPTILPRPVGRRLRCPIATRSTATAEAATPSAGAASCRWLSTTRQACKLVRAGVAW